MILSPAQALLRLDTHRRTLHAQSLRLQRDAFGQPFLHPRLTAFDFHDAEAPFLQQEPVCDTIAQALEIAEIWDDGWSAFDHAGHLHLQTFKSDGPRAARVLGRVGRIDIRLPSHGPDLGRAFPLPADNEGLVLLPGDKRPTPSRHDLLAAAHRLTTAGLTVPLPKRTPDVLHLTMVIRRDSRIVILPTNDQTRCLTSWPLHSSTLSREMEERKRVDTQAA